MEELITETEEIPTTLKTPGTTLKKTELKLKIDSLARESWFIRLQENKLKRGYHRSQSKIISKYLERDEDFIDNTIPPKESFRTFSLYENFRMRRRYQKALDVAKEKHPEFFVTNEERLQEYVNTHKNLHEHRVNKVSVEIRESLLAYGFIRGKSYAKIETDPRWKWHYDRPEPNWYNVANIVYRFTSVPNKQKVVVGTRVLPDGTKENIMQSAVLINLQEEIKRWKGN